MLPTTLLVGALFEFVGSGPALAVSSIFGPLTVTIVLLTTDIDWLIVSQMTFCLSFTAHFIVLAVLYSNLRGESYQLATSLNRSAMLISTLSSSALGELLVNTVGERTTLYVSEVSTGLAFVVTLVGWASGALPWRGSQSTSSGASPTPSSKQRSRSAKIVSQWVVLRRSLGAMFAVPSIFAWSLWSAVLLAVHSLVITYWQSLFKVRSSVAHSTLFLCQS